MSYYMWAYSQVTQMSCLFHGLLVKKPRYHRYFIVLFSLKTSTDILSKLTPSSLQCNLTAGLTTWRLTTRCLSMPKTFFFLISNFPTLSRAGDQWIDLT